MSGADQEWVKAALMDDTMVVELLVRLHAAAPPPLKPAALPLEWSVRQRRSKPVSVANPKKQQSQRASPTTPLSWSGATSLSGGSGGSGGAAAGGSEESSRPPIQKLSAATRSKVCARTTSSTKLSITRNLYVYVLRVSNFPMAGGGGGGWGQHRGYC
ncbi:UNVERIFIED_CONTAM: hypothetical protein Sradi_1048400 [Sesamum radiatum]|uniref:Uncharacterized protein n=1 Tax=Sesamum radiatum TaxID=300843 RepID=A0AAW2V6T0_SESRA